SLSVTDGTNTYYGSYSGQGAAPFQYTTTTTPALCPALGTATTTVFGGTPGYTFQYINQATNSIVSTSNPASLPAGNYDVLITDAAGCQFGSMYMFDSLQISSQNVMNVNTTNVPANCTNGSITINSITGGASPYTYSWSNGSTANSITGLSMGTYSLNVLDGNGCTEQHYIYLPQAVNINVNVTPTAATCLNTNGSAIAFGSGGATPYSYAWNNGSTSNSISGVSAGYYAVTATDNNGCIGQGGVYINATTPITVTYTTTTSLCTAPTGSASLSISGGATPYTVTWNTFPVQTGTNLTGAAPGTYAFHVVDQNGCVQNGSVVINPVSTVSANLISTPATCAQSDGAVNCMVNGGTPPYTYLWSTTNTTPSISNLPAGGYNVTVIDAMSCSKSFYATVGTSTPLTIGLTTTPSSCIYSNDGSINATVFGGATPYTWSGGSSTMSNLTTGNYWISVADGNGCTQTAMGYVACNNSSNACYCTLTGTVYHDVNNNCIQDSGEPGIPNIQIHCLGFGYDYTDANGVYSFQVPAGNYTLQENVLSFYPLAACQNNNIQVTATPSVGCVITNNFANSMNPIHDMKINIWDWSLPIPGFIATQKMIIANMGTINEPAAHASYKNDGQIGGTSFSPAGQFTQPMTSNEWYTTINGSGFASSPGQTDNYFLNRIVPTNIPLNTLLFSYDTVVASAPMSNWLNDYSPWDNVNSLTSNVVGAYDPNFKEVSPKGIGSNGNIQHKDSVLDYMVHFQNLGNYQAQNVVVLDTLDSDLDWSTLRPVYQSHPCTITISENGVAKFEFKNIVLPAKMYNEMGSQGMFSYSIHMKPNLPLGTQFKNSASIYFDFNEPVKTNTTVNTLAQPESSNDIPSKLSDLRIYPNPGKDLISILLPESTEAGKKIVSMTDVSGKQIYQFEYNLASGEYRIPANTQHVLPGMYFITVSDKTHQQTAKFIKIQ
ncbi:MAG TPA: T9SS type A sorting domain-containing protein, partial [Chitinophagaceae bacterium]|nr:T9SS type A sorting domain-containing protein [Chitinophagaceae bacterium]